MPIAKPMRAVQLLTEGRADDALALAGALHDQAAAVDDGGEQDQAAVTERLTALVIGVVAAMGKRDPAALDMALALVEEARLSGRPAWMATGRALAARVMVESGSSPDLVTMLALAELDLEDEVDAGRRLDPPNGPTGPGAAANNLGAVYTELGLVDRAEPHLLDAVRASSEEYGPDYRSQACVDLVNLLAFRFARALDCEADDDPAGAAQQACLGLAAVGEIAALAPEIDWPALVDWTRVLELGCQSLADPSTVPAGARHELRAIIDTSEEDGLLRGPGTFLVLARLCRLAGDASGASRAAERAERGSYGVDSPWLSWAWREAALAEVGPDSPAMSYARTLRGRVRRHGADLAAGLDHRIEEARRARADAAALGVR